MYGYEHQKRPSKIHRTVLAPEFHLARLVANLTNPHVTWVVDNPACKWDGINVLESGEIDEIEWDGRDLQGSMDFAHLPKTVRRVELKIQFLYLVVHLFFPRQRA